MKDEKIVETIVFNLISENHYFYAVIKNIFCKFYIET